LFEVFELQILIFTVGELQIRPNWTWMEEKPTVFVFQEASQIFWRIVVGGGEAPLASSAIFAPSSSLFFAVKTVE
jgi:hypothetical protein